MNPGNARIYGPVTRAPLLFHQNNLILNRNHYLGQQNYSPYSINTQPAFPLPTSSPSYYQSYPYRPPILGSIPPLPLGYPPVLIPDNIYSRRVSPNGLTLILIAILILVALDLTLVRPQKRY
ncbi:hypothetical protein DEAC_c16090 [Desulfosporosinus acididurans]|uniref:Uncharacterized protein n=1 Tax=Desulfosporosinus acididurans TaxID=476652 RepID=A0A0J1FRU7_9FIRM|nr:hypothetical protein DEAC_c16090 [Desulfosporosinus acididurans]